MRPGYNNSEQLHLVTDTLHNVLSVTSHFVTSCSTKKMLWQALADAINEELGSDISPLQVENKWKTLERAYKRTKERNSSSGHSRVTFEFEE